MLYLKHFSKLSVTLAFCLIAGSLFAADSTPIQNCLAQGKKLFFAQEYDASAAQFEKCLLRDSSHTETLLSLGGVYLTQNKLPQAKQNFQTALQTMKKTDPYISYTYSMLGDIALKEQQNNLALELYQKSLDSNVANVNSLVGKGIILEYKGNKKEAAQAYQTALAVEPLNLIARKRLINMEPLFFTDEEILAALKQRYAVAPEIKTLTDDQKTLFSKIHLMEQRHGVDYLKNKFPHFPSDYIVTLNKDTDFEREILTLTGYHAVQDQLGKDAIAAFQKAGIPVKDLFVLRDKSGNPVFDKDSHLTEEGFRVYLDVLKNKKSYLLPNEDVPPSAKRLQQIENAANQLKEQGYIEISFAELKILEKETLCSYDTLKDKLDVKFLPVTKTRFRFFIQSKEQQEPLKTIPYYYVMKERAKKDSSIKIPSNTLIESMQYFGGSTICLEDGNPLF